MKNRKTNGQCLVEMSVALTAILPVILMIFDLVLIVTAVSVNDAVCREATRVASIGSPSQSIDRAKSLVAKNKLYKLGGAVGNLQVVDKDTATNGKDLDKEVGGSATGTVTVTTSMDIYPPFLIGAIHKQVSGTEKITCYARQTMPCSFSAANRSEN